MITRKEVQHVAELARIGLIPKEVEKFQRELSSVLDYVEQLKEVDVKEIEPTFHSLPLKNVWRQDKAKKESEDRVKKLSQAFPQKKNGFLRVKPILER